MNLNRVAVLSFLAVAAAAAEPTALLADADHYVSPIGDDTNDGTAASPWGTIQHAADAVQPGDVVHVLAGRYLENVTTRSSGTEAAHIVFVSEPKWSAQIVASGGFTPITNGWQNRGNYVDIIGFDITGDVTVGVDNESAFSRVIGNRVHDLPVPCADEGGAGIVNGNNEPIPGVNHDLDAIGNIIYNIGDLSEPDPCPYVHGIYQQVPGGHIWNNIVYRTTGYGILNGQRASNIAISNNLAFENREGGIALDTDPPDVADWFVITNNISIHNGGVGIYEVDMLNDNPQSIGTHNVYLNNLVYGNSLGGIMVTPESVTQGTLTMDPGLVNYVPDGTGDYHLAAGSVCIDSGTTEGAPINDLEDAPRPLGLSYDRGPYERQP